jgi:hypothetical protein
MNHFFLHYWRQYFSLSDRNPFVLLDSILFYFSWKESRTQGRSPLADASPWITFRARHFLKQLLQKNMHIFEYGAGGSSLFFARYVSSVITVEHDEAWLEQVRKVMKTEKMINWQGYLVAPQEKAENAIADPSDPDAYVSADEQYKMYSFKQYATFINQYADESFDIVFVDGRSRPSCVKHALPKVKKGGYLILDNSDQVYYLKKTSEDDGFKNFIKIFDRFGPGPYSPLFWKTTVWRKEQ